MVSIRGELYVTSRFMMSLSAILSNLVVRGCKVFIDESWRWIAFRNVLISYVGVGLSVLMGWSYRWNFIVTSLLLFTFISTLKIILPLKCRHFVMNSLLLSKNDTVTKCRRFVRTKLRQSNIILPIMDDKYSFTRSRNALVSLIVSIESLEPPLYWYNISDNGIGSLCEFFRLK